MKFLKNIFAWAVLGLLIEITCFFYIDRIYLAESSNFNLKEVKLKSKQNQAKLDINIPDNANFLSVSFDGKFAAYSLNGKVSVVNRITGKIKEVQLTSGTSCNYLKWLDDRNRLYVVEKGSTSKGSFLQLLSYDAEKDEATVWQNEKAKNVVISLASKNYNVKSIAISTLTHVTYLYIEGLSRSIVYRIDVMYTVTKVKDSTVKLGKIGAMQINDQFIYEDLNHTKLYIEDHPNFYKEKNIINPCFLGADFDGNAYIGSRSKGKVKKIYYGSLEKNMSYWKSIDVPEDADENEITISTSGKIFIANDMLKNVTKLDDLKSYKYSGKLIKVTKYAVVYLDGNKLSEKVMN